MAKLKTVHLSAETIEVIEAALFHHVAEANTYMRLVPGNMWCSGARWVAQRAQGLSALRDVLTYAEVHHLQSPGSAASICDLAASHFHEGS